MHEWREHIIAGKSGGPSGKQDSNAGSRFGDSTCGACGACGAYRGCLGLEPTVQMFVAHLVDIFREVRRILRSDGTCWVNMGDSYNAYNGNRGAGGTVSAPTDASRPRLPAGTGLSDPVLKPKDLMLVPFRLALALQDDGWYVRNDIIWDKSEQCMPESIRDRCTRAHEFIFHLAKSERYFYGMEAVREPCVSGLSDIAKMQEQRTRLGGKHLINPDPLNKANAATNIGRKRGVGDPSGRNMRTVWRLGKSGTRMDWGEVQHFATYPEELPKRCILAGTSEYGVCADCGAPWERIVGEPEPTGGRGSGNKERKVADGGEGERLNTHMGSSIPWKPAMRNTLVWQPTCECHGTIEREEFDELVPELDDDGEPTGEVSEVTRSRTTYRPTIPLAEHPRAKAIVLDPFMGSGTTAFVAAQLNRDFCGIEMNPAYADIARKRVESELQQIKLI